MEAKDGSMGFDFAGTYTKIVKASVAPYNAGNLTVLTLLHDHHAGKCANFRCREKLPSMGLPVEARTRSGFCARIQEHCSFL
jgi:hypothetical protein